VLFGEFFGGAACDGEVGGGDGEVDGVGAAGDVAAGYTVAEGLGDVSGREASWGCGKKSGRGN
jgi:hypothetical protein